MRARDTNNVGRAVQTNPTYLRYASAISEQKKCWELLTQKFDRFQTLRNISQQHATRCNNRQQGVQMDATCNIQQRWEWLANIMLHLLHGTFYAFYPRRGGRRGGFYNLRAF